MIENSSRIYVGVYMDQGVSSLIAQFSQTRLKVTDDIKHRFCEPFFARTSRGGISFSTRPVALSFDWRTLSLSRLANVGQLNPDRCMVAGLLPSADITIDFGSDEAFRGLLIKQEVIEP
jgi:hypothetical protein